MNNENSRHNSSRTIKDVLSEIMHQPVYQKGINDVMVVKAWENVLGVSIMQITSNIYIKERILFVNLNSSVVRSELYINKKQIIDSINNYIGFNAIYDIILR
jgi:hypothetical protein